MAFDSSNRIYWSFWSCLTLTWARTLDWDLASGIYCHFIYLCGFYCELWVMTTTHSSPQSNWAPSLCPLHSRSLGWPGPSWALWVCCCELTIVSTRLMWAEGQWRGDLREERGAMRHQARIQRQQSDRPPAAAGDKEEKCICEICTCGWVCVGGELRHQQESHLVHSAVSPTWLSAGCQKQAARATQGHRRTLSYNWFSFRLTIEWHHDSWHHHSIWTNQWSPLSQIHIL